MSTALGKLEDLGPALLGASLGVFLAKLSDTTAGGSPAIFFGAVVLALVIFSSYYLAFALKGRGEVDAMIGFFVVYVISCLVFAWQFGGGALFPDAGAPFVVGLTSPAMMLMAVFPIVWHLLIVVCNQFLRAQG